MADPRTPDNINLQGVLPDTRGSLWGSNTTRRAHTFAQSIPRPQQPDARPPAPGVVTNLNASIENGRVTTKAPPEPERRVFDGPTCAVRAARLAHQYRVDFWGDSSAIATLGSDRGDPSEAALEQAYQDFVLFSYLPSQLMPTKAAFRDMSRPSARASIIREALPAMGINTTATTQQTPQTIETYDDPSNLPLITAPPPYSETMGSLCANALFKNNVSVRP